MAFLKGTSGGDDIVGTGLNDYILGLAGADVLNGADGVWYAERQHLNKQDQPNFSGYIVCRGMADTSQLPRGQ